MSRMSAIRTTAAAAALAALGGIAIAQQDRFSVTVPDGISFAEFRGYAKDPGGGLGGEPVAGQIIGLSDILRSRLWSRLTSFALYEFQTTMFQPVGGMGRIGEGFARQIPDRIRYGAKVVAIRQNDSGVAVEFEDLARGGTVREVRADWCVCAIPLSILSQIPINVSAPMKAAIDAVPYASAVKFGLQFSRRFWEEDEHIFGGITYTDLPIRQISYPSTNFNAGGKGVLLGGYTFDGANSYEFTAMPPAERVKRAALTVSGASETSSPRSSAPEGLRPQATPEARKPCGSPPSSSVTWSGTSIQRDFTAPPPRRARTSG